MKGAQPLNIEIRPETNQDYAAIKKVNDLAFGQPLEGLLVEKLRMNAQFIPELSLVAEFNDSVIGHILFFPIKIKDNSQTHDSLALAPMAVLPEYQKKGVGTKLVQEGLRIARRLAFKSVIVLGHKDYYPKFGFVPASTWHIKALYDVPDEVFMAMELDKDGLKGVSGVVQYPDEFDAVS